MATTIKDLDIPGLKFYEPKSAVATPKASDGTSSTELQSNSRNIRDITGKHTQDSPEAEL